LQHEGVENLACRLLALQEALAGTVTLGGRGKYAKPLIIPVKRLMIPVQAEMNAANLAEAKTEALRKAARSVEQISATLQSKADTIRQLSQQVR
jgi:hypothetical protein